MTLIRTRSSSFAWRGERLSWPVTTEVGPGLAGVIATETRVMWLDPSSGLLNYRGVPIEVLATEADFEEVAYLLITGRTPAQDPRGCAEFRHHLRTSRHLPSELSALIRDFDPSIHPIRLLRAGVSALGCHELSVDDELAGDRHWREMRIVGQVTALVEEIIRHRRGVPSPAADTGSSLADGLLRALNDRPPTAEQAAALNLLWVLYAAHGLDAPTFTSMVVASCLADPYYNVVSGLSALTGTRLGAASEQVLAQLLAREHPGEAREWVRQTLDQGGVVAGFGHSYYQMPDPRVVILRKAAAALSRRQGREALFDIARAVEDEATRALAAKGVHININFYGALLFHLLGADPPLGPCLFAVGRMAGLVALVREALDQIRLYRPLSRYVGPADRSLGEKQ